MQTYLFLFNHHHCLIAVLGPGAECFSAGYSSNMTTFIQQHGGLWIVNTELKKQVYVPIIHVVSPLSFLWYWSQEVKVFSILSQCIFKKYLFIYINMYNCLYWCCRINTSYSLKRQPQKGFFCSSPYQKVIDPYSKQYLHTVEVT